MLFLDKIEHILGDIRDRDIVEKAIKNIDIVLKGIGAGRESAIRAFINRAEINVKSIKDVTPIPHGGVKAPKPRRV